ncbi:MAG TPA: carboxypeptidase regulatory-like domain-containing protein, partial [Galbitalea sp.]
TLGSATPITLTSGLAVKGTNAVLTKINSLAPLTATPTPTVTGTAKSGQVLTAVPGTWTPAPVVLTYQWDRGGVPISGATSSTYTLVAADIGSTIKVEVTGQKVGYAPVTKQSSPTGVVSG